MNAESLSYSNPFSLFQHHRSWWFRLACQTNLSLTQFVAIDPIKICFATFRKYHLDTFQYFFRKKLLVLQKVILYRKGCKIKRLWQARMLSNRFETTQDCCCLVTQHQKYFSTFYQAPKQDFQCRYCLPSRFKEL